MGVSAGVPGLPNLIVGSGAAVRREGEEGGAEERGLPTPFAALRISETLRLSNKSFPYLHIYSDGIWLKKAFPAQRLRRHISITKDKQISITPKLVLLRKALG